MAQVARASARAAARTLCAFPTTAYPCPYTYPYVYLYTCPYSYLYFCPCPCPYPYPNPNPYPNPCLCPYPLQGSPWGCPTTCCSCTGTIS